MLEYEAKIITAEVEGSPFTEWIKSPVPGIVIPLKKVLQAAKRDGYVVCSTPEEIAKGRKHSTAILAHLTEEGEPKYWAKLVKQVEAEWKGFRVVPASAIPAQRQLPRAPEVPAVGGAG